MNFFEMVQKGKISSPIHKSFMPSLWDDEYSKSRISFDCDRIYKSGKIIFHLLEKIRSVNSKIPKWCMPEKHIQYLIGLCNRDSRTVSMLMKEDFSERKNPFMNDLEHFKISLQTGLEVTPDEVNASAVDALTVVILSVLSDDNLIVGNQLSDLEKIDLLADKINLCSVYRWIESIWRDCLWNGYGFSNDGDEGYIIEPQSDVAHSIAKMKAVTQYRRRIFRTNLVGLQGEFWRARFSKRLKNSLFLTKFVTEIRGRGKNKVIRLSTAEDDDLADQARFEAFVTKDFIQEEFYEEILTTPVIKLDGETVETLFEVWLVLRSLSRAAASRLAGTPVATPNTLLGFIASFPQTEILKIVAQATGISLDRIDKLLNFLTFRKRGDTLWTQPLVELEGKRFALTFSALHQADPLYVVESWLAMLSLDLGAKGNPFERQVRKSLKEAEKSNAIDGIFSILDTDFVFHPNCRGERKEEIDLIFRVGKMVYIGEIKCSVVPIEDIDFYNNRNILQGAVEQSLRKASCVERNIVAFRKQMQRRGFSIPLDAVVKPIVITNNLINSGYPIDSVPVVDIPILERYLEGKLTDLSFRAGLEPVSISTFYRSPEEAERFIEAYFLTPPQLRFYKNGLHLREMDIPANLFDATLPKLKRIEYEVIVDIDKLRTQFADDISRYSSSS